MLVLNDTAKNAVTVYIPFYDDIFQPVALGERHSPLALLVLSATGPTSFWP
jgi:hypothetical protein